MPALENLVSCTLSMKMCVKVEKYAKINKSMQKCANVCNRFCKHLQRYTDIKQKYAKMCNSVQTYEKI